MKIVQYIREGTFVFQTLITIDIISDHKCSAVAMTYNKKMIKKINYNTQFIALREKHWLRLSLSK